MTGSSLRRPRAGGAPCRRPRRQQRTKSCWCRSRSAPVQEGSRLTTQLARVGCGTPDGSIDLDPISIVCKVTSVDGRSAVKLSDNPEKATGDPAEIERYLLRVFGNVSRVRMAVHV
jgi:hypothetical protein